MTIFETVTLIIFIVMVILCAAQVAEITIRLKFSTRKQEVISGFSLLS